MEEKDYVASFEVNNTLIFMSNLSFLVTGYPPSQCNIIQIVAFFMNLIVLTLIYLRQDCGRGKMIVVDTV